VRLCKDCGSVKPDEEFSIRDKIRGYRNSYCKGCMVNRTKSWQKDNREKYNAYQREWHRGKAADNLPPD